MGLGKSATVYMLLDILQLASSAFFPCLIFAPKRVCEMVWPAEAVKWLEFKGIKVSVVLGDRREREDALITRADVYVINYDNVQWLMDFYKGKPWPFRIIVADESTRLKSFRLMKKGSKRANALSEIAFLAGRWINLSGTPSPNGLKDLWGQMWFIDRGQRLGATYGAFMRRWFRTDPYTGAVELMPGSDVVIHRQIEDVTMTLRAEDWFDIWEPVNTPVPVRLPPDAMKLYKDMERDYYLEIDTRGVEAVNAMAKSQKCLQLANGFVYDADRVPHAVHEAKLDALEGIIEETGGEPVIVCYFYQHDITMLKKRFPKIRFFQNTDDERDWNDGKIPLLALHPQSAAHGVNLQFGGRIMVFYAHQWNLELRLQAIERIGPTRQAQAGFNRAVLIYDIIAEKTLDEAVIDRLIGKKSVLDALMAHRAVRPT
jgi:hypothetical protein